jgi:hypothetical protein
MMIPVLCDLTLVRIGKSGIQHLAFGPIGQPHSYPARPRLAECYLLSA